MRGFAACLAAAVALGACASLQGLTGGGGGGGADAASDGETALDGQAEAAGGDDGGSDGSCDVPGNLLVAADNPSFELPACAGWEADNAVLSSSSVDYCGSFSCEACYAGGVLYGPSLHPSFPVLPGEVYLFTGYVRSAPGGPPVDLHAACHVADANGVEVEDIDGNTITTGSNWQQVSDLCPIADAGATMTILDFHAEEPDGGCFLADQAVLQRITDAGP
jgi:hypothetical protein